MVLLTVTPAVKEAISRYINLREDSSESGLKESKSESGDLLEAKVGSPIEHSKLIEISALLVKDARQHDEQSSSKEWRLDTLLKGMIIYQPPAPPKQEPTPEYKALMKRLRAEEEQRQYDLMINPPPQKETFNQRFPDAGYTFDPSTSIGQAPGATEVDEVTFADVNRQLGLIINVLVSIICCAVAIWVAARRWAVPLRLGMSMSGSGLVAVAEVVIYLGYIRRIKEAKVKEREKIETKEVVETWVLDGSKGTEKTPTNDSIRYRKGKHR